jgi:hypothetical protein
MDHNTWRYLVTKQTSGRGRLRVGGGWCANPTGSGTHSNKCATSKFRISEDFGVITRGIKEKPSLRVMGADQERWFFMAAHEHMNSVHWAC